MTITWRNVNAPNTSSANAAAARGVDTILKGLGGLSNTLGAGQRREDVAKQQEFDNALKLNQIDQGQQRIDAQQSQFDDNALAKVLAAETNQANLLERDRLNNADDIQAAKVLSDNRERAAKVKATADSLSKKSTGSKGYGSIGADTAKDIIANADSMSDQQAHNMTSLGKFVDNYRNTDGSRLPADVRAGLMASTYNPGFFFDSEDLSADVPFSKGIHTEDDFDNLLNEYLGTPSEAQIREQEVKQAALGIIRPSPK